MIDPNLQTETDRQVRDELISKGLLTPVEAQTEWTHIRLNMARIKANIARRRDEWAEAEGSKIPKGERYGRA